MIPILYSGSETAFDSNGIGMLTDTISCIVTEERNGAYEAVLQYPITGIHYSDIALRSIILAKPNPTTQPQPFRVYRMTQPMNGMVGIYCEHISYDMSGIPIQPFSSSTIVEAFTKLKSSAVTACPFVFTTDKSTVANMVVSAPCSMRSQLGGKAGSILDVYGGGEYEFDRYNVRLSQHRGINRGVSIRYGKNLMDLTQEQNCADVYTGVYPFWKSSDGGTVVQLTNKIINVDGTFDFVRILVLDLSSEWQSAPTQAQLQARAERYIKDNDIGIPKVSLTVSFAQLENFEEYKGQALLERVSLCDSVNVYFEKLGVNATAKAVKVVYNTLLERIESVELGDSKTKLTDSILAQEQALENIPDRNSIASMIELLTSEILGADGGSVRLLDNNGDGEPDTLYIADNSDPTKAVKVWRFNYEGWGASSNGYNGPFTMGATLNSGLVADFITAGTLQASLVKILGTTQFYWDAANINIINPNNTNQIIRIGRYDGTNYGIGFSKDGGKTWSASMDFDGVIATSIGAIEIKAEQITSGFLDAQRIKANSISVAKLTGTITNTDVSGGTAWKIDLDNGTMTIGSMNASHITAGTIDASKITVSNLNASNIASGTLKADRIAANSLSLGKLKTGSVFTTIGDTGITIKHASAANAYTVLDANGLKLYNSSGTVIGGLYVPTGQSTAKMGAGSLFNPSYGNFSIQLERFWNGEDMSYLYGLALYRKNVRVCGLAAPDSDSVDDGCLIGFNDWIVSINDILSVTSNWVGLNPSQFIMSGEGGGGSESGAYLIYAHGRANVSSSQARWIDFSAYGFSEVPSVVAQYSQTGSNISGDVGALKIYNKSATGFNAIIGGSTSQPDRDIDWIAIGFGYGK